MDSSVIKKYDKEGMIQIYEKWPEWQKMHLIQSTKY